MQSLNMLSTVSGFTKFNAPRVAQLSQRSNQFNLRTIRYTEADVNAMANDPETIDLSFTLEDKFGDNGLVAVVILKPTSKDTLFIDTWLMSCRVLKRGLEDFVLNTIVERAQSAGYQKILGEYIPTAKNKMVEQHYQNLGFQRSEGAITDLYEFAVVDYQPRVCFINNK